VVRSVEAWSARPPDDAGVWVEHALPVGGEIVWADEDNVVTGGQDASQGEVPRPGGYGTSFDQVVPVTVVPDLVMW